MIEMDKMPKLGFGLMRLPEKDEQIDHRFIKQVQHFEQVFIRGKDSLGFGHFPELAVKTLNGVGSIDQPPKLLGILKVGTEVRPVFPPGLGDFGIFLVPTLHEDIQSGQGRLLVHSGTDRFQIGHEQFQVLVGDILAGISQLYKKSDHRSFFMTISSTSCSRRFVIYSIAKTWASRINFLNAQVFS